MTQLLPRTPALALLASAWLAIAPAAPGAPEPVPEALVRAALVYNVAKLTEWPADAFAQASTPLTVCLLRDAQGYARIFESVEGKPVKGRVLEVRREVKLSQLERCHVLYLDEVDEPRVPAALSALRGRPVLTVGGFDGFAETGGMVGLFLEQKQMRVKINREALAEARLQVSAQLLRMAQIVSGSTP